MSDGNWEAMERDYKSTFINGVTVTERDVISFLYGNVPINYVTVNEINSDSKGEYLRISGRNHRGHKFYTSNITLQ